MTSRNSVSRVGRPGSSARSTEPSGSTSLRSTSKLQGLGLGWAWNGGFVGGGEGGAAASGELHGPCANALLVQRPTIIQQAQHAQLACGSRAHRTRRPGRRSQRAQRRGCRRPRGGWKTCPSLGMGEVIKDWLKRVSCRWCTALCVGWMAWHLSEPNNKAPKRRSTSTRGVGMQLKELPSCPAAHLAAPAARGRGR